MPSASARTGIIQNPEQKELGMPEDVSVGRSDGQPAQKQP